MSTTTTGLRVQASLDFVADTIGGRHAFIDACRQSGSEKATFFLAKWNSLTEDEQDECSLQDLCTRSSIDATELVGSIMGKLVIQSNNIAILKAALGRPQVMERNLRIAIHSEDEQNALKAQAMQFQMGGLLKGEGTQILNLTQNVTGTGVLSFEDDAHQSITSVKAEGRPALVAPVESTPLEVSGDIIDVLEDDNGAAT